MKTELVQDFFRLLKVISLKKFTNYLLLVTSYWFAALFKKNYHAGKPAFVSIEPTTSCNLHCPECFTSLPEFNRPKGRLQIDNFKKITDSLSERCFYMNLYFQGEPFLNEDLSAMIHYAKTKKFYVAVSTNGHFLDNATSRQLILSGLDKLIISLDGTDALTYLQYRKGGDFNKVISGIQNMVEARKKTKSSFPFLELQFLLTRANRHQVFEIKKLGKQLGVDAVKIKDIQLLNFANADAWLTEKNTRYTKDKEGKIKIKSTLPNRCFRMWSSCVITWDGNVVPCCFDKNASYAMGNIFHQKMDEICKGDAYRIFRQKVFSERKNIDICCNCSEGLKKKFSQ
ncbi:MAG: radical SAM/SPASM domain-containing protein [Bacteroidales bacterium]|nr:SPASM domain-containing protein [Bacteroidales bacterium]MDD4213524.1 radical SAM/SPASM domain-containing protein [Bacteroidales bacterium]